MVMRKKVVFLLVLYFSMQMACFALRTDEHNDAIKKLSRGIANVISSPLEIGDNMSEVIHDEGLFASVTYGVIKGIVDGVERLGVGIYEILTFPAPGPKKDYRPILTDPEFYGANKKVFREN